MAYAPKPTPNRIALGDLFAGLSVALIAIPQSLAYAELAGMPAYIGLYAVALPTLAAALFVSSPYLQTGPVATTSLLTFGVLSPLANPGSDDYLGLAILLALTVGVIRVLIGVFRFGRVAYLMSQPVLLGFTSAAAILILASQLPTALGVVSGATGVLPSALWTLTHPVTWNPVAAGLALATIALVLLGRRLHPLFPGVLLAVAIGVVAGRLLADPGAVIGSVPSGFPLPRLDLPWLAAPQILLGGVVIALIGFAEASSIARTYAVQDRSRWNANREFVSQGVANLAAALSGAFPVGGSFARSSINRLAGARSRWSGFVTGVTVLAFLPFTAVLSPLPKAVLAGIVIAAVINLVKLGALARLRQASRSQAIIAWLTFGLTLALSPRIDVAITLGIALAIAQHLRREQRVLVDHRVEGATLTLEPKGVLWFGSAPNVEEAINTLLGDTPGIERIVLDLGGLGRIDFSAAVMLGRLMDDMERAGITVELREVPPMAQAWVDRLWRIGHPD